MMNLSMSHPVPNFGDSFTVTCYVCGMPSSKEWAQKARSRPTTPMKPYFPFLLQVTPTGGACLREDGSTYLCAFCHASLEAQWNMYESQQVIPPPNRKYNTQKFICAVCGVETYRKRIRALPFQEFPFLEKQRQPGSITLGNNPLAVVCLDCSETLWAQSAEYDRWGLPVHKRHFNWMARPPPPEDSVEATVARLPSGETQLPRCPPTEPVLTIRNVEPPAVKILETQISSKARGKGKGESPKLENSHNISSPTPQQRKTSLTSTTPPSLDMVGGYHNQQPPVVTVAPMSNHTTVISLRKDSVTLTPTLIQASTGGIYPPGATAVYPPSATYAPYVWGNAPREATQRPIEGFAYAPATVETVVPAGTWPWIAHPSTDILRYQTYVSNLQTRPRIVETASGSPTHAGGSGSGSNYGSNSDIRVPGPSSSTVVSGALRDQERNLSDSERQVITISSGRRTGASAPEHYEEVVYHSKGSPGRGNRSPKVVVSATMDKPSTSASATKVCATQVKAGKETESIPLKSNSSAQTVESENIPAGVSPSTEEPVRREFHVPKKRNWQAYMRENQTVSSGTEENPSKTPPPTTAQEVHIPHPKKKKTSLQEDTTSKPVATTSRGGESAMDLSVPLDEADKSTEKALKGAGANKFRIEYLCQSTTQQSGESLSGDDIAKRTSVIRCAPKVPSVPENASQNEEEEEADIVEHNKSPEKIPGPVTAAEKVDDGKKRKVDRKRSLAAPPLEKIKEESGDEEKKKEDEDKKRKKSTVAVTDDAAQQEEKDERKEDESENEGKRQRQRKDSTDTDDDDKIEDLPNIEQFIKETVLELVNREKEREKVQKELGSKQQEFLNELGLITPDKKIDLDIKSIVSRHEKNTLPPLPLRPDMKLGRKIGKQLKELLLKVSLQDPTLFEEKPETEKCEFMAELGMKTAHTSEKTKREIKWRVILMERMRRELRDAAARGVKHEWEKSSILRKFASCDLDSFFNSLSYAALQASDEELEVESRKEVSKEDGKTGSGDENVETGEDSGSGASGVCINYPKYIPSYAVAGTGAPTSPSVKVETEEEACAKEGTSEEAPSFVEPILKIPVVPPKRRLQSESSSSATTATSDTDDSEVGNTERAVTLSSAPDSFKFSLGLSSRPYPLRIDSLIQCSNAYWKEMKRSIDEILNDLESSKEDVPLEDKSLHFDKLRKHLTSQLKDIKEIEKRFRATSKAICASRKKN